MTHTFARKTVLFALVILLLACCAFFACACENSDVSVSFSLREKPTSESGSTVEGTLSVDEEIVAGSTLSFSVTFKGPSDRVSLYEESPLCAPSAITRVPSTTEAISPPSTISKTQGDSS